eukprot:COSAG06_NODE_10531_length_1664_cov_11.412780_1_plen_117_part_00
MSVLPWARCTRSMSSRTAPTSSGGITPSTTAQPFVRIAESTPSSSASPVVPRMAYEANGGGGGWAAAPSAAAAAETLGIAAIAGRSLDAASQPDSAGCDGAPRSLDPARRSELALH